MSKPNECEYRVRCPYCSRHFPFLFRETSKFTHGRRIIRCVFCGDPFDVTHVVGSAPDPRPTAAPESDPAGRVWTKADAFLLVVGLVAVLAPSVVVLLLKQ